MRYRWNPDLRQLEYFFVDSSGYTFGWRRSTMANEYKHKEWHPLKDDHIMVKYKDTWCEPFYGYLES